MPPLTTTKDKIALAKHLADILHNINKLQPPPQPPPPKPPGYWKPIHYGYTLIYIGDNPLIYITLNYHKLCQENLYPTPAPITLQITHEQDTPLGKNKQILSATAACITHLFEWILEEYRIYKDFYPLPVPEHKLREYLEELWLQGKTLNNLTPEKIEPIKKPLPTLYRELRKALQAAQGLPDTHLTVRQPLKATCLQAYTDTTNKTPAHTTRQAHQLAQQAATAQHRLAQQHPPPRHHPCKTHHHTAGPWTIAAWQPPTTKDTPSRKPI